ncbi:hypothetical protein OG394_36265 [Kribbella sp. NBC_01245]|uniref:hypothetical protein n=1 Tax=Kribbella sp. NBC_01245 TaxID=2903578 RepID=UPI002E2DCF32|nr:hypothetical protein [Kribbella sp. NBC_01245]
MTTRLADGSEIRTRAKALQWLAEGIEASRSGRPPFDLGAPDGTRRLLYSGNVIDPATNQTVPVDPSRPAEPGNELHSGAVARAITNELPDTMTLEQTRDGGLADGLRLYEDGTHAPLPGGRTDTDLRERGRSVAGGQLRVLDGLAPPGSSAVPATNGERPAAYQRGAGRSQGIERG